MTGVERDRWIMLMGYARVSADGQDVAAQREALAELGVEEDRLYDNHGPGTNRDRPGRRKALDACCAGDTLIVTKLEELFDVTRSTVYRAVRRGTLGVSR